MGITLTPSNLAPTTREPKATTIGVFTNYTLPTSENRKNEKSIGASFLILEFVVMFVVLPERSMFRVHLN